MRHSPNYQKHSLLYSDRPFRYCAHQIFQAAYQGSTVMLKDDEWFSEPHLEGGCAFSLRIKRKLHEEQSRFQKIAVFETSDWGNLMVIDDCTMVSSRDNFIYHEMMSHPVLYIHAAPRRVAIIGGGDCGTLREVLKHPEVEQATQIDIDERVTRNI